MATRGAWALLLAAAALTGPLAEAASVLTAQVGGFPAGPHLHAYPVYAPDGSLLRMQTWRVSGGTGNCCENYLAVSRNGRLVDVGGEYPVFTDDRGLTWSYARHPLYTGFGEGAVAGAPGGDLLAMSWTVPLRVPGGNVPVPGTGDRVFTYRYAAAEDRWYSSETPLHTPFYDRPWLAAFKGPFLGGSVAYAGLMTGGHPDKTFHQVSPDGLHYMMPTQRSLQTQASVPVADAVRAVADPDADYLQPIGSAYMVALPGGTGLAGPNGEGVRQPLLCGPWSVLTSALGWACVQQPGVPAQRRFVVDSRGHFHAIFPLTTAAFEYRYSPDLGATWSTVVVDLPAGLQPKQGGSSAAQWDLKAHGGAQVAAYALRTSTPAGTDQDLVFRFDAAPGAVALREVLYLGLGDRFFGYDSSFALPRFDFASLAIFPDGKLAVSYGDSTHLSPSVAIEL